MSQEYKQLKDIKFADILGLEDGSFRNRCIAQLLECGFIKKAEKTYHIGQKFRNVCEGMYCGDTYILAQVDSGKVTLITISGKDAGNRYTEPIEINSPSNITADELKKLSGDTGFFELIDE